MTTTFGLFRSLRSEGEGSSAFADIGTIQPAYRVDRKNNSLRIIGIFEINKYRKYKLKTEIAELV